MIVYAFDDVQGVKLLERALKELIGEGLIFQGFTSTAALLHAAEQTLYDVAFADVECENGLKLLTELHRLYPRSNFIGVAEEAQISTALTLHRIYASGYLNKPYDKEALADTLRHLRFPSGTEKPHTTISA